MVGMVLTVPMAKGVTLEKREERVNVDNKDEWDPLGWQVNRVTKEVAVPKGVKDKQEVRVLLVTVVFKAKQEMLGKTELKEGEETQASKENKDFRE
ncbi:hypothetical protein [Salmonella sp. s51933]|uniref:hypothetical protein n=1 Tax=Salmonella sp. s51933 TaxID=3160127 RepID=UPI00375537AE